MRPGRSDGTKNYCLRAVTARDDPEQQMMFEATLGGYQGRWCQKPHSHQKGKQNQTLHDTESGSQIHIYMRSILIISKNHLHYM